MVEIKMMPRQRLSRNKSVIGNQLGVPVQPVTEEINRLRGQNDFTETEGQRIAARVLVLESILDAVAKIKAAFSEGSASTALTVIEEQ